MITKELLAKAIASSHQDCQGSEGCLHASAISELPEEVDEAISGSILSAISLGSPERAPESVFFHGLHVGYRLRQLEYAPIATASIGKEVVN
jgi:hypothetical protein